MSEALSCVRAVTTVSLALFAFSRHVEMRRRPTGRHSFSAPRVQTAPPCRRMLANSGHFGRNFKKTSPRAARRRSHANWPSA